MALIRRPGASICSPVIASRSIRGDESSQTLRGGARVGSFAHAGSGAGRIRDDAWVSGAISTPQGRFSADHPSAAIKVSDALSGVLPEIR